MKKNKVTRAEFDALEAEVKELKAMLAPSKTIAEAPALKKLDQSAFEHKFVTDALKYVALNKDGQSIFFSKRPSVNPRTGGWSCDSGQIMPMLYGYDASDWQNSLIERKPKLKQLDQSVFDGQDEKWQWAAMTTGARAPALYDSKPEPSKRHECYVNPHGEVTVLFELRDIYNTSDWRNSLIQRESKELAGSDLTRAMLERGDKYVVCLVSDDSQENTLLDGYSSAVESIANDGCFYGYDFTWSYATPINPRTGEPLTAKEAGF